MAPPIVIGGNGHSGTRLFAEILIACGINMGVPGLSYARSSKDLNIRRLMDQWVQPYLLGEVSNPDEMARQFSRRIRLLIPFRSRPWAFKNPRAMFLLPFYHELFPEMRFIHVIRDGRDISFGNPFVNSPAYWSFLSEEEARLLSPEERMIRFWGESNRRAKEYGEANLGNRYLFIRFEDICDHPDREIRRILDMIGAPYDLLPKLNTLVRKPKSVGRWREHEPTSIEKVLTLGRDYLAEFGYD